MDILKTLTNPYVLAGGAIIGLGLLLFSGNGGGSSAPDAGTAANLQLWGEGQRLNASLAQSAMSVQANIEGKRIDAQTETALGAMSLIGHLADVNAVRDVQLAQSRAGIWNMMATTNAAVTIDRQQNFARLGMAYVQSSTAKYEADTRLAVARVQAKAQTKQSEYALIGNVFSGLSKAATAAMGVPI